MCTGAAQPRTPPPLPPHVLPPRNTTTGTHSYTFIKARNLRVRAVLYSPCAVPGTPDMAPTADICGDGPCPRSGGGFEVQEVLLKCQLRVLSFLELCALHLPVKGVEAS